VQLTYLLSTSHPVGVVIHKHTGILNSLYLELNSGYARSPKNHLVLIVTTDYMSFLWFVAPVLSWQRSVFFSARQHICRAHYMLSPIRLLVFLTVRLSVTRVDQSKISQSCMILRSCNFHHSTD